MPQISWKKQQWYDPYESARCYAVDVDGVRVTVKAKDDVVTSFETIQAIAEKMIQTSLAEGGPPKEVTITTADLS